MGALGFQLRSSFRPTDPEAPGKTRKLASLGPPTRGAGRFGGAATSPREVQPGLQGRACTHAAGRPAAPPGGVRAPAGEGVGPGTAALPCAGRRGGAARGCHLSEGLVQLRGGGQAFRVDLRFFFTIFGQLRLIGSH